MNEHGFENGQVKQKLMRAAMEHKCFRGEWAAMPNVHMLLREGNSVVWAAKMVAIELGIPGSSFTEVVKDIRQLYPAWKAEIQPEDTAPSVMSKVTTK